MPAQHKRKGRKARELRRKRAEARQIEFLQTVERLRAAKKDGLVSYFMEAGFGRAVAIQLAMEQLEK